MQYRRAPPWTTYLAMYACGASVSPVASPRLSAAEALQADEEVVVIGSRLTRRDFIAPSPVVTLDAGELAIAGVTTIDEALNALPQVIADSAGSGPGAPDLAAINLRGLGTNRSLVTLNGRRFAPSGVLGAVDVNGIPAALIERVEVVTGGGSAVYGSDAVVGVVNFVLKDDFEGLRVAGHYERTDAGDGEVIDLNLSGGLEIADGRVNISGFLNLYDREAVLAGAREFTSVVISDDRETGELFEAGSTIVPDGAIFFPAAIIDGIPVRRVIFNSDGTLRPFIDPDDRYNFASANHIRIPLKRLMAATFADFEFSGRLRGVFEGLHGRTELAPNLAPTPAFNFGPVTIDDNPFLPPETRQIFRDSFDTDGDGRAEFLLARRMTEISPRRFETTRDTLRLLGALDGELDNGWRWQASYSYTHIDVDPVVANSLSSSRLQQALLIDPATGGCVDPAGGCVPINVFGAGNISREAADFVRFDDIENEEQVEEQLLNATIAGDIRQWNAGAVNAVLGAEWRKTEAAFAPDPILIDDDAQGFANFQPAIGTIEVSELFGEILIPLLADRPFARYLGVEAGGRYSDYNTTGGVTTWKLGVDWRPTSTLRTRLMLQRAVRAPNVVELFETRRELPATGFEPDEDLCSASQNVVASGLADICIAQGMDPALLGVFEASEDDFLTLLLGGNREVREEQSDSITVGVVVHPQQPAGLTVTLDYFDIEIDNAVQVIGREGLSICFLSGDPDNELCRGFVRGVTGAIEEVDVIPRNVSQVKSEGVDLQLQYQRETPSFALFNNDAQLKLNFYATRYLTNGTQASPLVPFVDCAGFFGFGCAFSSFGTLPDYKATTRLTYTTGPLRASLHWRWTSGMRNSAALEAELFNREQPVLAIPEIGSKSYFDLSGSYQISDHVKIVGGVTNLFDTDPPLLAGEAPGLNTDPSTYDVLGRRYFIGVSYRR